jgi:hypothetical protein
LAAAITGFALELLAAVVLWQAIVALLVRMPLSLAPIVVGQAGLAYMSSAVIPCFFVILLVDRV